MKIAILTSGVLPVPAVMGGAVETLIDSYLHYNNIHHIHDITVYSICREGIEQHPDLQSKVNHYYYIEAHSPLAKIKKKLYQVFHHNEYYHYTIEYYLEEAIKHIKQQSFDVIVIENRPAFGLKLRQKLDTPIIYHVHNKELHTETIHAKEIYDAATSIICVSDFIKSSVKAISPDDTKCTTIHNGIDTTIFSPSATPIDRAQLGLAPEDFVVMFCGRLIWEKGIIELTEAMLQLQDYPHIKLVFVGSPNNYEKEGNDLYWLEKDKAERLKNSVIVTGAVPYQSIPSYLKLGDIAVAPSVCDDAFPTTVLEAQAVGLPIITTRRGGIPEEVSEANAILLETDDHLPNKLASAILYLYQNPEKCANMRNASIERSRKFSSTEFSRNFLEAIKI